MNEVQKTGKADESWKSILQVPLPKKGNLRSLTNWRPICLVNHVVKILNRIILDRIQPAVESSLRGNQFGFRPNRSTAGAQATFLEIMEKSRRGAGVFVCFVDFQQAFPSLSFAAIKETLRAFDIPENLSSTIMCIYQDLKSHVKTPYGNTDSFPLLQGTLQGDVLAPYLFIMVLDRILVESIDINRLGLVTHSSGTRSRGLKELRVSDINYADDIVLFSESKEELSTMLHKLKTSAEKANLKINVGPNKTAWMTLGKVKDDGRPLQVATLGDIPKVTSYRYLGSTQNEEDRSSNSQERVRLGWAIMHKLKAIWSSTISPKSKLHIFKSLVQSVVYFNPGTWNLNQKELHEVEVQINRMRRVVLGVKCSKEAHCRVDSLYPTDLKPNTVIQLQRASLVGHLIRHPTPFVTAVLWRTNDESSKPSLSERCAKELHSDVSEILKLGQNRSQWCKKLENLQNQLEPRPSYTKTTSKLWENLLVKGVNKGCYETLQYIEEGRQPFPIRPNETHIYTDGARIVKKDETHTGCGVVCLRRREPSISLGLKPHHEFSQSIQEIESFAAHEALLIALSYDGDVILHTDSEYVWDFFHGAIHRFRFIGFKSFEGGAILQKLQETYISLRGTKRFYCVKVKAHNENPHNYMADWVAKQASKISKGEKALRFLRRDSSCRRQAQKPYQW